MVLCAAFGILLLLSGCSSWRQHVLREESRARQLADQARQASDEHDWETSEQYLEEAIATNPEDSEFRLQFADVLLSQGKTEQAVDQLKRAAKKNPDDFRSFVELSRVLIDQRRHQQAAAPLNYVLERDPENLDALLLWAQLQTLLGKNDQAMQAYHRILQVDPNHVDATLGIARLKLQKADSREAAPLLRAVCQAPDCTAEQRAKAYWQLGIAYGQDERWQDAVASLSQALHEGYPESVDHRYRLAYARYRSGDVATAAKDLQQLVADHPQFAPAQSLVNQLSLRAFAHSMGVVPVQHIDDEIIVPPDWSE